MTSNAPPRVLSGWDIAAIGLNAVIGSGIFLLPGSAAENLGPAALAAFAVAGGLCLLIALCFADAGSRFSGTGGPSLYAEAAFGPFVGFQVAWISWIIRVVSWAALANGFAMALAVVVPSLSEWTTQVATGVLVALGVANGFGVRLGASIVNGLTVVKLIPLLAFVAIGIFAADLGRLEPFAPHGWSPLGATVLLVLWAYAGFENVGVPAGEVRNPQRAVPRALVGVMALVTVLYLLVFWVAATTHPSLAGSGAPVAEAAMEVMGSVGGPFIAVGIAISVLGTCAGSAIVAPRFLYALVADRPRFPILARLHPVTGAPIPAIVVSTVISVILAASGSFEQLAVVSVVARFAQYIPTCLAVLVFQRRGSPPTQGFTLPGGPTIPVVTTVLCLGLLALAPGPRLLAGCAAVLAGLPAYGLLRRPGR
ncbi:MAG: APC family permease [Myxococcota bacterium]